jgi:hypothetical protein
MNTPEICGCDADHTTHASETLKGLRNRFAIVATAPAKCGTSYWSFLDPNVMSSFSDVTGATRASYWGILELRKIVGCTVTRGSERGIGKG